MPRSPSPRLLKLAAVVPCLWMSLMAMGGPGLVSSHKTTISFRFHTPHKPSKICKQVCKPILPLPASILKRIPLPLLCGAAGDMASNRRRATARCTRGPPVGIHLGPQRQLCAGCVVCTSGVLPRGRGAPWASNEISTPGSSAGAEEERAHARMCTQARCQTNIRGTANESPLWSGYGLLACIFNGIHLSAPYVRRRQS
jgi:hypothetical protein